MIDHSAAVFVCESIGIRLVEIKPKEWFAYMNYPRDECIGWGPTRDYCAGVAVRALEYRAEHGN